MAEIFSLYHPPGDVYDELLDDESQPRPHWRRFAESLSDEGRVDLLDRWQTANRLLRENGVTHSVVGQDQEGLRPWELDLLPVVFDQREWESIDRGVRQRARLVAAVTADLYGEQTLLRGSLPPRVLFRHPEYQRAYFDLPKSQTPLALFGCELARSESGQWWVMADRSSAPAGISYAVENRIVISKTLPQILHRCQIQRLAPFFILLQESLKQLARRRRSNPSIVLLSGGPNHPYYFEDVFLARYLGYPLVEIEDLAVRKNRVWIKTLEGLVPVDVILWRSPDRNIDPLELGGFSPDGVAGLLQVLRNKNVVVANGFQYSLLDAPVFMPFLPAICRELLGEELILPSIATWWCGQREPLEFVLERFDELVIKPAFGRSGSEEYIVSELADERREALHARIMADPENFVAQEKIKRSSAPCWVQNELRVGHLALRTFAVGRGSEFETMPGGLVRVGLSTAPMPLSISAGAFSKDVWVCAEEPVPPVSLLARAGGPTRLARVNLRLPSRAADNLFWLGRYLERLEFAGRHIRKVTERLMSESAAQPVQDVLPLIACLAEQGLIEESWGVREFLPARDELELVWPRIVAQRSDPQRFGSLRDKVYRLASTVRDRLSDDLWRAFTAIGARDFPLRSGRDLDLSELSQSIERLLLHISSITGQVFDGLVDGPTRWFLLIGKHVERAQQLTGTLSHFLNQQADADVLSLVTLLDVCNSLLTYRSRYRSQFSLLPAIDLVVTDGGNPRSMRHQFEQLRSLLGALPRRKGSRGLSPEERIVEEALVELRTILPDPDADVEWDDYRTQLTDFLARCEDRTGRITDELSAAYFIHTGKVRLIDQNIPQER